MFAKQPHIFAISENTYQSSFNKKSYTFYMSYMYVSFLEKLFFYLMVRFLSSIITMKTSFYNKENIIRPIF